MKIGRRGLYWISALAIGAALVYFLKSRGIRFEAISDAIARFPLGKLLLAGTFITLMQLPLQSTRLWAMLPLPRTASWWGILRAFIFGQAINSFAPARAGDALKVVVMNRESKKRVSLAVATGVLLSDKLLDILSVVALCIIECRSWFREIPALPLPALRGAGYALLVLIGALAIVYFGFARVRARLLTLYVSIKQGLGEGLSPLRNLRQSIPALGFSMLGWVGEMLAIQALCAGQGYHLGLDQVMWAVLVLNIGVAVPLAVANIGAFEASMAFGLGQVGIPAVEGLAIATVHHLFQILGVYLWAGGLAVTRALSDKGKRAPI